MKNIEDFINYIENIRKYSKDTVNSYTIDILEYYDYIKLNNLNYLKITYQDVCNYLEFLYNIKKDIASTVARKISALRSFYKYLVVNHIADNNMFRLISLPKQEKKLPKYFYYNELEDLFKVSNLKTSLGQRDSLILEMLYATGIRVSELVNIKINDIDKNRQMIKILGKGNKERIVLYGEYAGDSLNLYLNDGYLELNKNNSSFLFLNKLGNKLTTRGIRYILDRMIKKTSLTKNISPHMIRHSFATHLLNEGCDLLSVQELLGHATLAATERYTHVTSDRLKEVYHKCFPRK